MNSRPAGLSDDDSDEFEFSSSYDTPKVAKVLVQTNDDKFISAILSNNIDQVKTLLDEGVDVNKPNTSDKWTPLMHACYLGHNEIVKILMSRNADPLAHYQLMTPIMCVCDSPCKDEDLLVDCYNILINHGADVNIKDWYNSTPLMHAARHDHPKLAYKLLELGCDINEEDSDGWTPIFYAVDAGHLNMVQLLKDADADLFHEDRKGRNLTEIASSKHFKDILDIVGKDKTEVEEENLEVRTITSNFQTLLEECPNLSKSRLYGFSSDALKIIKGIGLQSLVHTFNTHNVQLGQLLTWEDAQWKEIGVKMSFDRLKLKSCVQKYHEHAWNKDSLKIQDEEFNQLTLIQQLCNIVKQFHIISLTSYYYLNNAKNSEKNDVKILTQKALFNIKTIKKELEFIKKYAQEMERKNPIVPADLITPNMRKRSVLKTYIIPGVFLILIITQVPKLNVIKFIK